MRRGDIDADAVRRRFGSFQELLADRPVEPPWVESQTRITDDLTSRDDDLFRMVSRGSCGIDREFYKRVGGYDESFTGWGVRDVDLAYRAYNPRRAADTGV